MGNKPFKIAVRLDEDVCEAGQVITGKVYLSIGRSYDVKNLRGIHLVLDGVECVTVVIEPGTFEYNIRRRRGSPLADSSTHSFVHVDYPLVDLTGISRGQYEYPFQLPLLDDLPASLKCPSGETNHSACSIEYSLTAYIAYAGARNSSIDSMLRHKQVLKMKGKPLNPLVAGPKPIHTDTQIFPITSCWFWGRRRGHIALGWSSSCSVAGPGDSLLVQTWGENQSKLRVNNVSVKLIEEVVWRTEELSGSCTPKRSSRVLAKQQQSPAPNHPQWMASNNLPSSHQAFLNDIQDSNLSFTFAIPLDSRETYKGHLIEVKHSLVICVVTSGGCASSTAESTFPVRILSNSQQTIATSNMDRRHEPVSFPAVAPSAPSELYDISGQEVLVEAQVLPADWNPIEAPLVCLPLASAVATTDESTVVPSPRTTGTHSTETWVTSSLPDHTCDCARTSEIAHRTSSTASPPSRNDIDADDDQLGQLAKLVAECPENLTVVLEDPVWAGRIKDLSPREFGKFVQICSSRRITAVSAPSPQEEGVAARAVALCMGSSFQVKHLLACLWMLSDGTHDADAAATSRITLLQELSPLASDIASKRSMIEEELNSQELAVFHAANKL